MTYSLLRLGLLAACFAGLLWAGANPWLAIVAATFLAWGLSYVLLPGPRDAAALVIAERVERRAARAGRSQREADDDAAEDAAVDAALAAGLQREAHTEQDAVAELEQAGPGEDRDQGDAARADQDREREQPGR